MRYAFFVATALAIVSLTAAAEAQAFKTGDIFTGNSPVEGMVVGKVFKDARGYWFAVPEPSRAGASPVSNVESPAVRALISDFSSGKLVEARPFLESGAKETVCDINAKPVCSDHQFVTFSVPHACRVQNSYNLPAHNQVRLEWVCGDGAVGALSFVTFSDEKVAGVRTLLGDAPVVIGTPNG